MKALNQEWVKLMVQAKKQGLTKEEIKVFLKESGAKESKLRVN